MRKANKPIQPRQFILNSPELPLTQAELRCFVLQTDFPPLWGPVMESELKSRLTALGFQKVWCQCLDTHPIARVRMNRGTATALPAPAIKRLLRKIVREVGCSVSRGGMNVWVQRHQIEAGIVMEQPV